MHFVSEHFSENFLHQFLIGIILTTVGHYNLVAMKYDTVLSLLFR